MKPFKVVLVGDSGVGKTCIADRAVSNTFSAESSPTVGAVLLPLHTPAGTDVTFELWDTAGQERYHTLLPLYCRGAAAAVICLDLSRRSTFESVGEWVKSIKHDAGGDCEIVLLGNKADLVDQRDLRLDEAENAAFQFGIDFFMEVSAKTGQGINAFFERLAGDFAGKTQQPRSAAMIRSPVALSTTESAGGSGCC
jgi:small GTP-binding protein